MGASKVRTLVCLSVESSASSSSSVMLCAPWLLTLMVTCSWQGTEEQSCAPTTVAASLLKAASGVTVSLTFESGSW